MLAFSRKQAFSETCVCLLAFQKVVCCNLTIMSQFKHYYLSESGSHSHIQEPLRGLKLTQEPEDFELKKGLLCLLTSLSADQASAKVMAEEKIIRSLLSFVTRNDKAEMSPWNPAQFEELQLLVSKRIVCIVPTPGSWKGKSPGVEANLLVNYLPSRAKRANCTCTCDSVCYS